MSTAAPLAVQPADRRRLARLVRADPQIATRAKIVVLAARGLSTTRIAHVLGVTRPTVTSWRSRYAAGGIAALETAPRPGRPRLVDESAVVLATIRDQPPGGTRWSARSLGEHVGASASTVAKIWRNWGLRPARPGELTLSTSPPVPARFRDIVGLHLDPPCQAVLVRLDPSRPARASASGSGPRMCAERALPVGRAQSPDPLDGLLVGLRRASGVSADPCFPVSRSRSLVLFLADAAAAFPGEELHALVGGPTARSADVRAFARRHRRVRVHATAESPPWPALAGVVLRLASPDHAGALDHAVAGFVDGWQAGAESFSWLAARRADRAA